MNKYLSLLFVALVAAVGSSNAFNILDDGNVMDPLISNNPLGVNEVTVQMYRAAVISEVWHEATCLYRPDRNCRYFDHSLKRPAHEATPRNLNTALGHASAYHGILLNAADKPRMDGFLLAVGLDPEDTTTSLDTPVGIGKRAAELVVFARLNDAMNRLGNHPDSQSPGLNYTDTTGYRPANDDVKLLFVNRWQPDILYDEETLRHRVQKYITPQVAEVETFGYGVSSIHRPDIRNMYRFPVHHPFNQAFFDQVDEVLQSTQDMTLEQKLTFELWDNKIFGPSLINTHIAYNVMDTDGGNTTKKIFNAVDINLVANEAGFDSFISSWAAKTRYDSVRPFSIIRTFYADQQVPMRDRETGGVKMVPGKEWSSWGYTDAHPEYPSGTTCFCSAMFTAVRHLIGQDNMPNPFQVTFAPGSSVREPGVTPVSETTLTYNSLSEVIHQCGQSRLWGGVHFSPSIHEGAVCPEIGDRVYSRFQQDFVSN